MGIEKWFGRLVGVVEKADTPQAPVETSLHKEEAGRWVRDSIEAKRQPKGGRGLADYELCLGFKREDLRGKRVLDLGTGPEGKFAKEVAQLGIEAQIVGVSPDFSIQKHRNRISNAGLTQSIAAIGQELPFKEGSFDIVVSTHAIDHLGSEEEFFTFVVESARVLKQGGKAYIGPLFRESHLNISCYGILHNPKLEAIFERMGIEIEVEDISESYGIEKLYDPITGMGIGRALYKRLILKKKTKE